MKIVFVDTNVFLRLYLADIKPQARQAKRLFEQAKLGKLQFVTNVPVLFETIFVLTRSYSKPKKEVIEFIKYLLATPGLLIEHDEILTGALEIFGRYSLSVVDAYNIAWSRARGINSILSFDRDYKKIPGIELI